VRRAILAALIAVPLGVASAHGSSAAKGSLIAFWSDRGGLPGVWVMKTDGSARRLLTGTRARAKRSDFSPNGRMLVFDGQPARGNVFDFDIQVIRVDGRGRKRLTHGPARDLEPRWSPDGKAIVFQRQYGEFGPRSIWTIRPSGKGLRRLAEGSSPVWSADGRTLLFARATAEELGTDIYRMNADGTGAGLLYRSPDDDVPSAAAKDGRILFTRLSRSRPAADVYLMKSDGAGARRLPLGSGFRVGAAFSPDGRKILFTRVTRRPNGERGQVSVANVDGSKIRNLSRNRFDENAESWSR
jgi:TolB protein